jgi:tRNA pseudouridine55 synthase
LDPLATGVLIVGYNNGTKLLSKYIGDNKEYEAQIQFGTQTDSYDITGKVTGNKPYNHINLKEVEIALDDFKNNEYYQTPPIFSAKKINGQTLYFLARNNHPIGAIKPQLVKLIDYQIINFFKGILKIKLTVSKGFYIRSLANDLGLKLKSCATLIELRRTKSGNFLIKDSIPLDKLLDNNQQDE